MPLCACVCVSVTAYQLGIDVATICHTRFHVFSSLLIRANALRSGSLSNPGAWDTAQNHSWLNTWSYMHDSAHRVLCFLAK